MNKKVLKLTVMIIILNVTVFLFSNFANAASQASLNCPTTVNLDDSFNVKLNLPEGVTSAQATVTVKFSNESTKTQEIIFVNYGGLNMDSPASFVATVAGNATITVSNILLLGGAEGNTEIEKGGSLSAQLTINAPTPPEPVNNTTTDTTNTSTNTSTNTAANTSTQTNTATNTSTVTNTVKNTATNTATNTTKNNTTKNDVNTNTTITMTFKEVNDTVITNTGCRIRKAPNTEKNTDTVAIVGENTKLSRTGIGDGWSRVTYNGQIGYIRNDLIDKEDSLKNNTVNNTTTNQVKNTVNNSVNNTVNNVVNNTTTNNTLTNEEKLEIIKKEVGVLPEVGNNLAVIIYIVITSLSILLSIIITYKNR